MFVPLFKSAPFVRLLPPFIAGIMVQQYCLYTLLPMLLSSLSILVLLVVSSLLPMRIRFQVKKCQDVLTVLLAGHMGMLSAYAYDIRHAPHWVGPLEKDSCVLQVTLLEPLVEKRASWKALAAVKGRVVDGVVRPCQGYTILYFAKDSVKPLLDYGSILLVRNKLQRIKGAGNPGAFDYGVYCARSNIYHQAYLHESDWRRLPGRDERRVMRWLLEVKQYCLTLVRKHVGGPEAGLAQALLIGYRDEMDEEVVQAYTNTGVVHIIAISGLHLGLIYVSLVWLLSWMPGGRASSLLKVVVILIVLWGFSIVTGASASVLRSAVMFTMIAIGQFVLVRHTNIFNTLAASAFLLLCYNPCFIMDVGFQLSYLAVLSILIFYKPLYGLWEIRATWLDKLWQMVAVTLSAQLLTIPICLYYFHQFPNFFLLANLVAVPLSTIILYAEIFLVVFGSVSVLGHWLGWAVSWGIKIMNGVVVWVNGLPHAVSDNLWLGGTEALLLYMLTGCFAIWWLLKKRYAFFAVLVCWVGQAAIRTWHQLYAQQQRMMIVYNIPGSSVLGFIEGQRQMLLGDTISPKQTAFHLRPAHMKYRMLNDSVAGFLRERNVLQFYHIRCVLIDGRVNYQPSSHKLKTDYVLMLHNPSVSISQLSEQFEFSAVIFDASNQAKRIRNWKNECKALTLRSFSVPEQGAFVLNL
ncbi:ComEC family competence protein [Chitinophaga horti]|uniref:ComEC family competence protein n=1 Tax=Chitinophaga horti TaxID=2920382 RepID=A0ABY6J467_9BACT|nr:ComEC/Rec2 family competence protein [Chitinophaga horti]UYQ93002.1 ComEC family competence protein [Chitinophaga horti]